ncbi:hypothetical protein [Niallia sp. 03133]|uniref:hypothetical protein n=1 Tax=Niallia sp. 03133 TaxID=3458060 RepID=UPI00404496D8
MVKIRCSGTNTYDNAGQLTAKTFKDLVSNTSLATTFTYTTNNLVDKYTQGNYYSTNYVYDEMELLKIKRLIIVMQFKQ